METKQLSVPTAVWTTYHTEAIERDGMHRLFSRVEFGAVPGLRAIRCQLRDGPLIDQPGSFISPGLSLGAPMLLTAGDLLDFECYQTSGGNLTVTATTHVHEEATRGTVTTVSRR